jgi:hypothetical protein
MAPQHDETIVPVRPGLRAAVAPTAGTGAATPARKRPTLLVAGAALVAAAAAVFWWLPNWVERSRDAETVAVPPSAPVVEVPAGPQLSPEELAALEMQAQDLLAGLLTQQADLRPLNLAEWAADDQRRYEELSEAGDNAFLANDFASAGARRGNG